MARQTPEQMRELGRKGGIKSGEARRKNSPVVMDKIAAAATREAIREHAAKAIADAGIIEEALDGLVADMRQKEHPKIAQDARIALLSWAIGKPGQEVTHKGPALPPAFIIERPPVSGQSRRVEIVVPEEKPKLELAPAPDEPEAA